MTARAQTLRQGAETLAGTLPPLLADAEHLASAVLLGAHGRRRAGIGDEFWQYRPARPGDPVRLIDWRRSARSDATHFVREKEWQAAQTVELWVDASQSMEFASSANLPTKGERARLLTLAIAVLLIRGGERVGLGEGALQARGGEVQLQRIADVLSAAGEAEDYGAPTAKGMPPRSRAVFVSDFMGDVAAVAAAMTKAADRGVKGAVLQVLDPVEEIFPFDGRTRFESMTGALSFETRKAGGLKRRYLDRLAARKAELADLARSTGWQFTTHHTDPPAQSTLLWLYRALERVR
jgi:uncharacterized protein (DUF58 family)